MNITGYLVFAAVALLGIAAISARNNLALRRWVIRVYCAVIVFLAAAVYLVAPRLAMDQFEASGGTWSSEIAKGVNAMHGVYMALDGLLFIVAVVLVVLASRPPKQ